MIAHFLVDLPIVFYLFNPELFSFLIVFLSSAEKTPNDKSYEALCTSLSTLAKIDSSRLQGWLSRMIMGPATSDEDSENGSSKVQENRLLLQSLTSYIVKENR